MKRFAPYKVAKASRRKPGKGATAANKRVQRTHSRVTLLAEKRKRRATRPRR